MRSPSSLVVSIAVAVLLACGDDDRSGTTGPEPCHVQAVYEQAALEGVSEQDVRAAVLDAAERLAKGEGAEELQAALRTLHGTAGAQGVDGVCRAIRAAREELAAQEETAESRPDVAAIELVLGVAETYYARAR